MIPRQAPPSPGRLGFPRVSGDDPDAALYVEAVSEFSPRERG